jgi:hypothetical protein
MNMYNYALNIAGWYPENSSSIVAIFIKKHIELIASFTPVVTLSVHTSSKKSVETNIISDNLHEVRVFYIPAQWRIWQQVQLVLAYFRGYCHIKNKYNVPYIIHLHVVFPAGVFVWLLLFYKKIPY